MEYIRVAQYICRMVATCEHSNELVRCYQWPGTSWLAERLLALNGRLCSTKLLKI
jgi:hypothetical protein